MRVESGLAGRRRMVSNRIVTAAVEGGSGAVIVSGESFPGAFKRILVPTDGGYAARGAAELALLYATAAGAEVTALAAQTDASSFPSDEPRRVSARVIQDIVQLGARHGVTIDGQVRISQSAARTIVEAARELSADLIVIGAIPQTLGRQTFLGNTVEYVLRYAPCPVVVFLPPSPRSAAKAA